MPWFRVDDGFAEHAKLAPLENEPERWARAVSLWLAAGCYCSRRPSDGIIERERVWRVSPLPRKVAEQAVADLVACALWHEVPIGYQFHDWAKYNPTKEQVLARRDLAAERQKKWRDSRKSNAVTDSVTNAPGDAQQTDASRVPPSPSPSPSPDLNKPPRAREPEAHDPGDPVQLELIAELAQHRAYAGHDLAAHAAKIASFAQGNGKPWDRYAEWYLATIRRVADKAEGADAAGKPWPAESVGSYLTQACRQPSDPASFAASEPRAGGRARQAPQDNDAATAKRILASQAKDESPEVPF